MIANEHTLADMALEFVVIPLWRHAVKLADGAATAGGAARHGSSGVLTALASPSVALPLAAGMTAAAVAVLLYWRRDRLPTLTSLKSMF